MSFIRHYHHFFTTFTGFSFVGIIVTLVSMVLVFVCNEVLGWNGIISYLFAYVISILLSYLLNTLCVWKVSLSLMSMVRYHGIYIVSMMLGAFLLWLFEQVLPDVNETILSYCVLPFTMLWNYFFTNKILSE